MDSSKDKQKTDDPKQDLKMIPYSGIRTGWWKALNAKPREF